jgi:hypothetical protein
MITQEQVKKMLAQINGEFNRLDGEIAALKARLAKLEPTAEPTRTEQPPQQDSVTLFGPKDDGPRRGRPPKASIFNDAG